MMLNEKVIKGLQTIVTELEDLTVIVDKTMTAMKKDGSIVSPVRCKWEPAEK